MISPFLLLWTLVCHWPKNQPLVSALKNISSSEPTLFDKVVKSCSEQGLLFNLLIQMRVCPESISDPVGPKKLPWSPLRSILCICQAGSGIEHQASSVKLTPHCSSPQIKHLPLFIWNISMSTMVHSGPFLGSGVGFAAFLIIQIAHLERRMFPHWAPTMTLYSCGSLTVQLHDLCNQCSDYV